MPDEAMTEAGVHRRHKTFKRAVVSAAVAVLALLVLQVTGVLGAETRMVVSNAAFVVASAIAAACCAVAFGREEGRLRQAWSLLCAAASLWTVGNLFWFYYQVLADHQPFPAVNDIFYLAALPLAVMGMLSFPAAATSVAGRLRSVLDGLMVASALLVISWVLVLGPAFRTTGLGPLARAVFLAYPAGDVIIVTLALLVATQGRRDARLPLLLCAAALSSYALADSAYALKTAQGDFAIGSVLDLGWISGYLMLALAALAPTRSTHDGAGAGQRLTAANALLPYLPVFLALGVTAAGRVSVSDDPFLFATVVFLLTAFAGRQFLVLLENHSLSRELEARVQLRTADLQRLSKRTESILDSAGEGIYGVDLEGRATFVNSATTALTGYPVAELTGQRMHDLVHHSSTGGDDRQWETCSISTALEGGYTVQAKDEVYRRRDGSSFPVEHTVTAMRDEAGAVTGAVVVFRDVTERRAMDQMKDEFISVVSHELRTPLTSIRGALGLLAGGALGALPEKGQRMADIAVENTDRLVRLINDILDIERMTSGKVALNKQVSETSELMGQVAELMRPLARAASVGVEVETDQSRLWADPDRLVQTLTNLAGNAIKFSSPGSKVTMGATRVGDEVVFKVADHGRGIPPEKLEEIFGRFQQVDASDSREKGGTGLGLAICRSIVDQHGGRIWAENRPGGGALFSFTLPVLATASAQATSPAGHEAAVVDAADDGASHQRPAVLVCDDDPLVLGVVEAMLEQRGFRPVLAASGEEAVELSVTERPAVILLDLLMPGMSGWATAAALKERPETADIPIVVLSVLPPDGDDSLGVVFSDWVCKSADETALLRALEAAMEGRQSPNVLIVEDDSDLASVLQSMFEGRGLTTTHVNSGREAVNASRALTPDLLVLDLGLPDGDGFAVVDWMREHDRLRQVPLVVYTARDLDETDRRRLTLGATSYFTKGRVSPEDFEHHVMGLLGRMTANGKTGGDGGNGQTHPRR